MKGTKGKTPAIQWYYKDWLSDRKLQRADPASRGVWMNLLMHMVDCSVDGQDCEEGILEDLTIPELMSLGGCTEDQAWGFLEDALKHGFCNIELDRSRDCLPTFNIMSRRLSRDSHERAKWRERKRKQREKESGKDDVTRDVTEKSQPNHGTSPIPTPTPTPKGVKKDQRSSTAAKADSSKHFSEKVGPFLDQILKSCKQLETLSQTNGKRINPYQWVQQKVKKNVHPEAITESLDGLVQYWDSAGNPWGYIESIFKTKNQNYNERQHMAQAKEFASAWQADPKVKALMSDFGSMP